jgi:hypothetical protein
MAATTRSRLKDPAGGLTAAGRRHFKKTEGANLKPGVKLVKSPEDMKRKGAFLRRHYAKKAISPLKDEQGKPTRYALQAHAWGERVPKTRADVKKLARKGSNLVQQYHEQQEAPAGSRSTTSASTSETSGRTRRMREGSRTR